MRNDTEHCATTAPNGRVVGRLILSAFSSAFSGALSRRRKTSSRRWGDALPSRAHGMQHGLSRRRAGGGFSAPEFLYDANLIIYSSQLFPVVRAPAEAAETTHLKKAGPRPASHGFCPRDVRDPSARGANPPWKEAAPLQPRSIGLAKSASDRERVEEAIFHRASSSPSPCLLMRPKRISSGHEGEHRW